MPLKIIRNDITCMQVDVIVNTANAAPIFAEGTDTAVYRAAGEEALLKERQKIGYLEEGEVAITSGFRLPAKYIIHAVSPLFVGGENHEEEKLRLCYKRSLKLASEYGCKSIAFPLISTGCYGYPKEEAMRIAVDEINGYLLQQDMLVYLVVFDEQSTILGRYLYPKLESYITQYYVEKKEKEEYCLEKAVLPSTAILANREKTPHINKIFQGRRERQSKASFPMPNSRFEEETVCAEAVETSEQEDDIYEEMLEARESALEERMKHMSDTFQEYLLYLIKSKGLTNSKVYKRAILSKQLFSKIKLNPQYHPDKLTAMRLCVGAELNLDEAKDLLARAGYALSPCDKRDIIFSFFIENKIFDMIDIDIALEEHGLPCIIE